MRWHVLHHTARGNGLTWGHPQGIFAEMRLHGQPKVPLPHKSLSFHSRTPSPPYTSATHTVFDRKGKAQHNLLLLLGYTSPLSFPSRSLLMRLCAHLNTSPCVLHVADECCCTFLLPWQQVAASYRCLFLLTDVSPLLPHHHSSHRTISPPKHPSKNLTLRSWTPSVLHTSATRSALKAKRSPGLPCSWVTLLTSAGPLPQGCPNVLPSPVGSHLAREGCRYHSLGKGKPSTVCSWATLLSVSPQSSVVSSLQENKPAWAPLRHPGISLRMLPAPLSDVGSHAQAPAAPGWHFPTLGPPRLSGTNIPCLPMGRAGSWRLLATSWEGACCSCRSTTPAGTQCRGPWPSGYCGAQAQGLHQRERQENGPWSLLADPAWRLRRFAARQGQDQGCCTGSQAAAPCCWSIWAPLVLPGVTGAYQARVTGRLWEQGKGHGGPGAVSSLVGGKGLSRRGLLQWVNTCLRGWYHRQSLGFLTTGLSLMSKGCWTGMGCIWERGGKSMFGNRPC